ncbi:hypothetical protein [Nocardiopsis tropica]|uniref:Uncharacterized protein n=1 Tax=Nocardiopsis tropica TaxID=109330 RepID=A0ABU7KP27_9ACTN|nr:hypothetical protein [Nocardiopsis umidischolae]MEE2051038.1 hypothetical protein [Nocardiopsis umidischolae]
MVDDRLYTEGTQEQHRGVLRLRVVLRDRLQALALQEFSHLPHEHVRGVPGPLPLDEYYAPDYLNGTDG